MARPATGRQLCGFSLGSTRKDWKPMPTVGAGVREIRIHVDGKFRVFYVTNIGNAIYVLHAFQKKTPQTSQKDIALGKKRYKQIGE
ncbi:MAG: type II toxin-antitoxin system RelE/ParE family toxin [Pseudomonadales bacterium]|nr:type II toxin-antitoxin system RelE/ParE family toxin [Pseudomonadales bacterium]